MLNFLINPVQMKKRKSILHVIGGGWYVDKLGQKLPLLKKRNLSKKCQKEEDKIKRRLTEANQEWNDWKFQIHWNKLEFVNPRSCDERKINFVCLKIKIVLKITINLHIWLVTQN